MCDLELTDLGDATTETREGSPPLRPDNDVEIGFV